MIKRVLIILLFLPSMTFGIFPGISSMPWGILLLPFLNSKQLGRVFLAIFSLLFLTSFHLIFFNLEFNGIIKSLSALLNATIVIPFIISLEKDSKIFVKKIFIYYIITTIIFGFLQLNFDLVKEFSGFIFGHVSGFGSKGVPGLSYEPARSALDMVYCLVAINYFYRNNKLINYFTIISILYLVFINRSITGIVLLIFYYGIIFFKKFSIKKIFYFSLASSLIVLGFFRIISSGTEIHALNSIFEIINSTDKIDLIQQLSGHRGTGLIVSFQNISIFGNGSGSWEPLTLEYLKNNIDVISNISYYKNAGIVASPPLSFFGRFVMEFGIVGMLTYFYFILGKQKVKKIITMDISLFLIISLTVLSYGSNPIPFIILSLILSDYVNTTNLNQQKSLN
jgi:hypothetical protein